MSSPKNLTSLIIPVRGALPLLEACLESLGRHTPEPHEIILVDNGNPPPVARALARLGAGRVIRNPANLGFARAINQGMRAASGRRLAWVNSDLVVTEGWLSRLGGCLSRDRTLGATGPCTNKTVGAQAVAGAPGRPGRALDLFAAAWALRHARRRLLIHRLVGFCVLLPRAAVESVGLLDERFGAGCYEDFDYCLRLRQAGYRLAVAQDSFVFHHEHGSFRSEAAFLRLARRNRELFVRKWCGEALRFWDELDPLLAQGRPPRRGFEKNRV